MARVDVILGEVFIDGVIVGVFVDDWGSRRRVRSLMLMGFWSECLSMRFWSECSL